MKIYVVFDEIADKPVDCFFANNDNEATTRLENQIINLEKRLGKFKHYFKLYAYDDLNLKLKTSIKTFKSRG